MSAADFAVMYGKAKLAETKEKETRKALKNAVSLDALMEKRRKRN